MGKNQLEVVNNFIVNSLDWVYEEKIHVVNTLAQNYTSRPYNNNFYITNQETMLAPKESIVDKSSKEATTPTPNPKFQSTKIVTSTLEIYNIVEELGKIKSNATLLDLTKKPE